jgi:hypothetical protein
MQEQKPRQEASLGVLSAVVGCQGPEKVPGIPCAAASPSSSSTGDGSWIVDSGASRHITPHKHILSNLRKLEHQVSLICANGTSAEVDYEGDVYAVVRDSKGQDCTLALCNVLLVPGAAFNLLSLRTAVKKGCAVYFPPVMDQCNLTVPGDKGSCFTIEAQRSDAFSGVYGFEASYEGARELAAAAGQLADEQQVLWHRRLGHLGGASLARVPLMTDGTGLNGMRQCFAQPCEQCALGKQVRHPFPVSTSEKTTELLGLIHMDLMGPLPRTGQGYRYVATFLDEASGFSVVVPLQRKSDVQEAVMETVVLLEKQTGCKVKIVRTDNGGEYRMFTIAL